MVKLLITPQFGLRIEVNGVEQHVSMILFNEKGRNGIIRKVKG